MSFGLLNNQICFVFLFFFFVYKTSGSKTSAFLYQPNDLLNYNSGCHSVVLSCFMFFCYYGDRWATKKMLVFFSLFKKVWCLTLVLQLFKLLRNFSDMIGIVLLMWKKFVKINISSRDKKKQQKIDVYSKKTQPINPITLFSFYEQTYGMLVHDRGCPINVQ